MDRNKYITDEERSFISKSINRQIDELKKGLEDERNFIRKKEIDNITIMREDGDDINGDE